MKRLLYIIASLLVVVLVTIVLRCGFLDVLAIPQDGEYPTLLRGDRVLLNRWSYGWRSPFGHHQRYRSRLPRRYHWVAFDQPTDTSRLCVGQVLAAPGDTVWMGSAGRVSDHRNYSTGCIWPLSLPAHGSYVRIHPWSAPLYAIVINRYESARAEVRDQVLYVNGHKTDVFRFQRDYFWIASGDPDNLNDSRTFGFVPYQYFIGRLQTVLYSFDPGQPFWRSWRRQRTFQPLP